jgi:antitoxin MazE
MNSTLIKIGNSRGVRIPKSLLEEGGLKDLIDIKVVKGGLKIVPISAKPKITFNEEYLLSLSSLGDWDTPEEDAAWASLQ